ncbi:MAG: vitamin B12 dependent-methionine synthase activation domain-containing protein [Promethearchaeota archaeon]
MEIIDPIPFELDVEDLLETLTNRRLREKDITPLIDECQQLIEPRAVYEFIRVVNVDNDTIHVEGGYNLKSIILGDLLEDQQMIVPYVVTIGSKLEQKASEEAKMSVLKGFIMEQIADYTVSKARLYVSSLTKERLGKTVYNFSPGSGTGKLFDITQQEILFKIIDPTDAIGVHLSPSYVMQPRKSISGILAATPIEYVACEYCPQKCENRKKEYRGEYIGHHCEQDVC